MERGRRSSGSVSALCVWGVYVCARGFTLHKTPETSASPPSTPIAPTGRPTARGPTHVSNKVGVCNAGLP
jgi:hypothetical protein